MKQYKHVCVTYIGAYMYKHKSLGNMSFTKAGAGFTVILSSLLFFTSSVIAFNQLGVASMLSKLSHT